jgi:hypothetical protein
MMKLTRPGYGTRGLDTLEKKDFEICTEKAWSKVSLNVVYKSTFVNIEYMGNNSGEVPIWSDKVKWDSRTGA